MKKLIFFTLLCSGLVFAQSNNKNGNSNALGLWIGSGFGLDFKHLNNDNTVWDVYLGTPKLRFSNVNSEISLGLDGSYYFLYDIIKADASAGRFPLYWGPNLGVGIWSGGPNGGVDEYSGLSLGGNIVGGISWFLPTAFKMDISLEIYNGLELWHESRKWADGNWHDVTELRFHFFGFRLLFHAYLF